MNRLTKKISGGIIALSFLGFVQVAQADYAQPVDSSKDTEYEKFVKALMDPCIDIERFLQTINDNRQDQGQGQNYITAQCKIEKK